MTEEAIEKENAAIAKAYKELLKVSYQTLSRKDKKLIRHAFEVAVDAHKDQRRKSGEAYIFHSIAVAKIVAQEIGLDATSIAAALLHDVVEDNPNYEKAVFTVETDGQISPIDAFKEAITTMYSQMSVFNKVFDLSEVKMVEATSSDSSIDLKDLIVKIEDLNLSARSFNSLDRAGIKFVGDLALMSEVEVKSIKNLGKKSLEEISDKFAEIGYPIDGSLDEDTASALRKKLEQLKA